MGTTTAPQPPIFRIFISYASEDVEIAKAVASCFKAALPDFFAEVNFDKNSLEPGSAFQAQIETQLQQTDRFIIVYTGADKPSHSYTGWEVGYFDHIMRTDPGTRKKISLYLFDPPDTTALDQGIPLGLSKEQLRSSFPDFESSLLVLPDEPLCKEIEHWQEEVTRNIEKSGFPRPQRRRDQEPPKCVHNLRLEIFRYLKGTVENMVQPQKQVKIRVKGSALEQSSSSLPSEAELRPIGKSGSMGIFGLADEPITWKEFLTRTATQPFADSWNYAISSAVLSSFPEKVDVDNSQVILAVDGITAYRIVLTTATKYYDDYREYTLYFVSMLQRTNQGDPETTSLLKGLQLVCRFRFNFLEDESEFLGENVGLAEVHKLPELASSLLKELNLMHKDAQEAKLDKPGKWTKYVKIEHLKNIEKAFTPSESRLREIIPKVMAAISQPALLAPLREEMAEVLRGMEKALRPENTMLLREMTTQLVKIVERQDQVGTATGTP
jgi:hypothetical protein